MGTQDVPSSLVREIAGAAVDGSGARNAEAGSMFR
jgi:hypothetical protein